MGKLNWSEEPVVLSALIAGLLVAAGGTLVAIGEGIDPLVAIGQGLAEFGIVVGGGFLGRSRAYSPRRYEDDIEAHDYILERTRDQ